MLSEKTKELLNAFLVQFESELGFYPNNITLMANSDQGTPEQAENLVNEHFFVLNEGAALTWVSNSFDINQTNVICDYIFTPEEEKATCRRCENETPADQMDERGQYCSSCTLVLYMEWQQEQKELNTYYYSTRL